jgi:hypothetical protein
VTKRTAPFGRKVDEFLSSLVATADDGLVADLIGSLKSMLHRHIVFSPPTFQEAASFLEGRHQ